MRTLQTLSFLIILGFAVSCSKKETPPPVPTADFTWDIQTNGFVQFNNNSKDAQTYKWEFGDGKSPSIETSPKHEFDNNNTFKVTLTATGTGGVATKSYDLKVSNIPAPEPDFTYIINANGCVQFTNISKNADTYSWVFGDNNLATSQNPQNCYAFNDTYEVTLTAKGKGGEIKKKQSIIITNSKDREPLPTFSVAYLEKGVVQFTNTSTYSTTYNWNFGDGTTSTETSPKHAYSENKTYNVILTAKGKGGTNTKTSEIEVKNAPIIVPTKIYITKISITDVNPLKISSSYKTLKVVVSRGSAGIGSAVWESNEFSPPLKSGTLYDLTNNKLPLLISQPSQDLGFALQGFSYFSYDTIIGTVTKTIGETLKSEGYPLKRKSGCATCDIEFEVEFKYEY
jgi:PKD repeat protein